ncbi:unnamed protein product, partial [Brassica oleracea var. botrytis]
GELPFTSACHVITTGEGGSATSALSHTFDYLRKAFIVCGLGLAFSDFGVYVGLFFLILVQQPLPFFNAVS